MIGGNQAGEGNVISGNSANAIIVSGSSSDNNKIVGNLIGTNTSGTFPIQNGDGIQIIDATNTTIGGSTTADRNLISGNSRNGNGFAYAIKINGSVSSGTTIQGNYIGSNMAGTAAISNDAGIAIDRSGSNSIIDNLITGRSASTFAHIQLSDSSSNTIRGNYIGTNSDGSLSLNNVAGMPDGGGGISLQDSDSNTIDSNLISGNNNGIVIQSTDSGGSKSSNLNSIISNKIGTDATGTSAIPNNNGIVLSASGSNPASQNTIGGDGKGNLISGNGLLFGQGSGILLLGRSVYSNNITGNYIGTGLNQPDISIGNMDEGILIDTSGAPQPNRIGAPGTLTNYIAHNGKAGIKVFAGTATILSNSIFQNSGLGIDLIPSIQSNGSSDESSGVTDNDAFDADSGANNLQNFPAFTVTNVRGASTADLDFVATPGSDLTVQFFLNSDIDATGYGEGRTFLTERNLLKAGSNGRVTGSIPLGVLLEKTESVSATATDSAGNTSEFSISVAATEDVKPGTRIENPPAVVVAETSVTFTFELFKVPKKKRAVATAAAASKVGNGKVQYELTIVNSATRKSIKRTSKKNILTVKNLPPGNYTASYRARILQGKNEVATTRRSPKASFTVENS
jgi:parallel beta-helix repeat protein